MGTFPYVFIHFFHMEYLINSLSENTDINIFLYIVLKLRRNLFTALGAVPLKKYRILNLRKILGNIDYILHFWHYKFAK